MTECEACSVGCLTCTDSSPFSCSSCLDSY